MGIGKETWLLCIPLALWGCIGADSSRQSALGEPCTSGADCQAGLYCDVGASGVCTKPCETDNGCGAGFTCYYALCVEVCATNGDCSPGLNCNDVGHCTNPRANFPDGGEHGGGEHDGGGHAGGNTDMNLENHADFGYPADLSQVPPPVDLGSATRDIGNSSPPDMSRADAGSPADHCSNGKHDGNETDVDCGGYCRPCQFGQQCKTDEDCSRALAFGEGPYGSVCKNNHCDCDVGYKQSGYDYDLGDVCDCDPETCNTCCDYRSGSPGGIVSKCGIIWVNIGDKPEQNNCGVKGQQCFFCEYRQTHFFLEACVYSSIAQEDYCADWYSCGEDSLSCGGCCGGDRWPGPYCLRGDEDDACGKDGAACVACPAGTHCVDGSCQ